MKSKIKKVPKTSIVKQSSVQRIIRHHCPKQRIIGLKELRENMEEYIKAVEKGEKVTVVRRSKPIFVLQSPDDDDQDAWETVIDFTDIEPKGVPINKVITTLHKMQ